MQNDLTSIVDSGTICSDQFQDECKNDPSRFERPIKRKIKNFTSDAVKTKVKSKDQTILEVRCTRDIFGRLLFLAVTQNLDMATVLSYPLTHVPFTLCHITGEMNKTNKSALMAKLEGKGDSNEEPSLVYVIDAMFFLRTLPELPSTFGGIAKMILHKIQKVRQSKVSSVRNVKTIKQHTK